MEPITIDESVVEKILQLQPKKIPEPLLQNPPIRTEHDFNPNTYFTVLTRIGMKPEYVLDYVYHYMTRFAGSPCLYARRIDEKPLGSFHEYNKWAERNDLNSFLVADGSPDSFFQLTVFRRLAEQFYLYWHANYNDIRILTAPAEIEALISEANEEDFGKKFTDEQVEAMRAVDPRPAVHLGGYIADFGGFGDTVVTYYEFSKWSGLMQCKDFYVGQHTYDLIDTARLPKVEYHCGFCY
jgi:hypothetical protein